MSSVLKLSFLSAIVAISTILTHPLSAFASTLYSNMFIDNLSNWQQEFGLCNVSPTGLSCNGTGTPTFSSTLDDLKNLRSLNMIDQGSFSSLSSLVKNAQNYSWLKFINDLQLQTALTVLKAQAHKINIVAYNTLLYDLNYLLNH